MPNVWGKSQKNHVWQSFRDNKKSRQKYRRQSVDAKNSFMWE